MTKRNLVFGTLLAGGVLAVAATNRAALLSRLPLAERVLTRWVPPEVGNTPPSGAAREQGALATLGRQVRGRLIWASNRGGNHDLYEAILSTGRVRKLTTHPHVDYFPRYSPDGLLISFLRTRRTWASFREGGASDLFVMNANGTGERRLVEHADHATWAPDGKSLVFMRVSQNRIVRFELGSGRETTVYDGAGKPTEGDVNDPALGPDNLLAVTLRGVPRKQRGVGVVDLKHGTYRPLSSSPRACHITWVPGEPTAVWIESGGSGGTRVMRSGSDGRSEGVLMDLPGPYSHEYFPRISPDRQWLVWGAAAEGHEHDRADYEIFAWKIGTPWEAAIRLTYSPANDQWPDLFPE